MTILECELHCYLDGQLADQQRADILAELRVSAQLAREVAELRMLKHLVRLGYPSVAPPSGAGRGSQDE